MHVLLNQHDSLIRHAVLKDVLCALIIKYYLLSFVLHYHVSTVARCRQTKGMRGVQLVAIYNLTEKNLFVSSLSNKFFV